MNVALRCTVRGCPSHLRDEGARWVCERGHSFDRHRSGYLSLLQPQDTRSRNPGDSKEAALARRRLADKAINQDLHRALAKALGTRTPPTSLLDVGCGEGAFLRSTKDIQGLERHGIDISARASELAAKADSTSLFVIGNADRFLPYADQSFDCITSIDARLNSNEFRRVLKRGGLILVAVAAPDDLIELREKVQGGRIEKGRADRVESELGTAFRLLDRTTVSEARTLEVDELRDILAATYRGFREAERASVEGLSSMRVTLSHEILAFQSREA